VSISFASFGGTEGYYVRVTRHGKTHAKFFKKKKEAQQYEKELIARLPPPKSQKGKQKGKVKTNTGIRRIVEAENRWGSPCYRVYWRTVDGQPRCSEVSIAKHGKAKALKIAKGIKREKDEERSAAD
jgi:hypothetical protein